MEIQLSLAQETLRPFFDSVTGQWTSEAETLPAGKWEVAAWLHRELAGDIRLLGRSSGVFSTDNPQPWHLHLHWGNARPPRPLLKEIFNTLHTGGSWVEIRGWVKVNGQIGRHIHHRLEVI